MALARLRLMQTAIQRSKSVAASEAGCIVFRTEGGVFCLHGGHGACAPLVRTQEPEIVLHVCILWNNSETSHTSP